MKHKAKLPSSKGKSAPRPPVAASKRHWVGVVDREGKCGIPGVVKAQVGDDFAWWENGDSGDEWIIAFPKTARARRAIPAHAHWGKIEPGLPDKVPPPRVEKGRKPETALPSQVAKLLKASVKSLKAGQVSPPLDLTPFRKD